MLNSFVHFLIYCSFFLLLQIGFILQLSVSIEEILSMTLLLSLVALIIPPRKRRLYFYGLSLSCFIPNLIFVETYVLLRMPLKVEHIVSALLSNSSEIYEFLSLSVLWKIVLGAIPALLSLVCVKFLPYKNNFYKIKKALFLGVICLGLLFEGSFFLYAYNIYVQCKNLLSSAYLDFKIEQEHVSVGSVKDLDTHSNQKTYIVIISDSVGREYLSLYGGKYNTTPFLDQIKNQLYVFDNVTTRYDVTYKVMEKMLSFSENDKDENLIFEMPILLDIYKKAGFKIYWLSSFPQISKRNKFSYLIDAAEETFFRKKYEHYSSDEILFTPLKRALEDEVKQKIIFMHLQGSHLEYRSRYPADFGNKIYELTKLKSESGIDHRFIEYLMTIRYGDEVLRNIFSIIKQYKIGSAFVLYFSDHAEDVDLYGKASFCHGSLDKKEVLEIPFVLWLSE